ncbi:diphthamide biosynthesis protein [Auriscalpium vulgare]|uniref:Diphthamide biosynthesis protein n=1 Tax=Auriscalpium vulgare TaxID=40419 RepID=A0ACB8S8I0_9AGAM|nr:diphthamide biosynthesis protein [Auriscalpium vulgare]
MAENTAFSSSGEDAISRPVILDSQEARPTTMSPAEFAEYYEIDRTVQEIISGQFKRIALQFPDELLSDAVPIYQRLKGRIQADAELYVLADTSYGSCCVDEVAAQHVDADAVIHYGHACMSQTYRLPVIYVFGKKPVNDLDDLAHKLVASLTATGVNARSVVLRHDIAYTHLADSILETLRARLQESQITVSYSAIPHKLDSSTTSPRTIQKPVEDSDPHMSPPILYVGPPSLGLTNLLLTHSLVPVHRYDPSTREVHLESVRTNKLLMRRYAVVQKARDADVVGILVGTLGVASYLPLISHLRQSLKLAHKKSYTISVGKLNPSKLANFMEIECFVLVACPENSLIEAKEFLRPIVTPFELQIALQPEPVWTGEYILDFEKILAQDATASSTPGRDLDEPTFSLVTGKYRHAKRYGGVDMPSNPDPNQTSAVILRDQNGTVATLKDSAAGEFLQSRTFQGLETRIGLDAPSVLEQGRSGIARGYGETV